MCAVSSRFRSATLPLPSVRTPIVSVSRRIAIPSRASASDSSFQNEPMFLGHEERDAAHAQKVPLDERDAGALAERGAGRFAPAGPPMIQEVIVEAAISRRLGLRALRAAREKAEGHERACSRVGPREPAALCRHGQEPTGRTRRRRCSTARRIGDKAVVGIGLLAPSDYAEELPHHETR